MLAVPGREGGRQLTSAEERWVSNDRIESGATDREDLRKGKREVRGPVLTGPGLALQMSPDPCCELLCLWVDAGAEIVDERRKPQVVAVLASSEARGSQAVSDQ